MLDLMRGSASRSNIVRSALWSLADHMGYDPPLSVFDMRNNEKDQRAPRKRGKGNYVRKRTPNPGIKQNQPASHPWRKGWHPSTAHQKAVNS